jgi:uncharacterized protein
MDRTTQKPLEIGSLLQQPTKPGERIETIDVLRGFMLCAIMLMNIELFTVSMRDIDAGISASLTGLSWWADTLIYTLLHGKGWTLFSLLFGVGFAVMRKQAKAKGQALVKVWTRRALVLLVIGVAHATLVWSGDVLVTYSVVAMALLLFRNATPLKAALIGVACFGFPLSLALVSASFAMTMPASPAADPRALAEVAARAAEISALSQGSFADATAVRTAFLVGSLPPKLLFMPLVLGMALIGVALFDSGALTRPSEHRRLWIRLLVIGAAGGGALTAASVALDSDPTFIGVAVEGKTYMATLLHLLGAPLLAVAYAAGVVLLSLQARAGQRLAQLAPVGRLALTNYLAQSLICTTIFYGYGFGLWGELSRFGQLVLGVAIFAAQVKLSRWYVERYRYGPMEWLWRWGTYGKRPAFRNVRHTEPAASGVDLRELQAKAALQVQVVQARQGMKL